MDWLIRLPQSRLALARVCLIVKYGNKKLNYDQILKEISERITTTSRTYVFGVGRAIYYYC